MGLKFVKNGIWRSVEKEEKKKDVKFKPENIDSGILNWIRGDKK